VYAKVFDANGVPRASQAVASPPSSNGQSAMDIAMDRLGAFAVTWYSQVPRSMELDVWVRRFNASGTALGTAMRANVSTAGAQVGNRIAMSPLGDFVVVWESYGQSSATWDIFARRYGANGVPQGSEFLVNTMLAGEQNLADVAVMDDGTFVIAWGSDNRSNDPASDPMVYARQYRADGSPVAPESALNLPTTRAFWPHIGLDRTGHFLVGWLGYDTGSTDQEVYARRFVMDTLPPIATLTNNQVLTGLDGVAGSWRYFKIAVPPGFTIIDVSIAGAGDADLYVRYAGLPTAELWDARPFLVGSNESLRITNIPAGDWYIGIRGFEAYSSVTLNARF
jgi:serine protease